MNPTNPIIKDNHNYLDNLQYLYKIYGITETHRRLNKANRELDLEYNEFKRLIKK